MDFSKVAVIDVESNGLLSDMVDFNTKPFKLKSSAKLWVVVITNLESGESEVAVNDNITKDWMEDKLSGYDVIVSHNGVKFDLVTLSLFGVLDYKIGYLTEKDICFGRDVWFIDTLIWSRLFNPIRSGGHSLSAYGKKIGNHKMDFRERSIEEGIIDAKCLPGDEFKVFSDIMVEYCIQDTMVSCDIFKNLWGVFNYSNSWKRASKMEHKLADLSINREMTGFEFNKEKAIELVKDLGSRMEEISKEINPIIPRKNLTKVELNKYTPPKLQLDKNGNPTKGLISFCKRVNATIESIETDGDKLFGNKDYYLVYKNNSFSIPYNQPLETTGESSINDTNTVKQFLLDSGWEPTEWSLRNLNQDSNKKDISVKKSVTALRKWMKETMDGKFEKDRLKYIKSNDYESIYNNLIESIQKGYGAVVPTSPNIRVGVAKDLCPNLLKLGDKLWWVKKYSLFCTYKHRLSSIASKNALSIDLKNETPPSGYLRHLREDGRIPTPAFEIGTISNRYTHSIVANIPRPSSIYGGEMRSLFGSGKGYKQFGFDYSSLENRIQGHYVKPFKGGDELALSLVAEKPNDLHSLNAIKLNIDREEAKSVGYAILYGCGFSKFVKMLGMTKRESKIFYNNYWEAVPALKSLKDKLEFYWEHKWDKKYIVSLDGRKILSKSKHSLLNYLFQSSGVIFAKYVEVIFFEMLEKQSFKINPFKDVVDICNMCSYHDEMNLMVKDGLFLRKEFNTDKEAKEYIKININENLSDITHKDGKFLVYLPNHIVKILDKAVMKTEKLLKLRVDMGYEWAVGDTWEDVH